MYYLTFRDMELILNRVNVRYGMKEHIVNKGQLEFALYKPKIKLVGGSEQYPELYQKAAILMETITKLHPFTDGNKRCAMMAAEYMIYRNNCELILPLKTIRFSVDIATDDQDKMREEIQKWFSIHIINNPFKLFLVLIEQLEEESIIQNMFKEKKFDEAEKLVSFWMAFDTYSEHKKKWDDLVEKWKKSEPIKEIVETKILSDSAKWDSLRELGKYLTLSHGSHLDAEMLEIKKIEQLHVVGHSIPELTAQEEFVNNYDKHLPKDPVERADLITSSGTMLEEYKRYKEALECYELALKSDKNNTHTLFHKARILDHRFDRLTDAKTVYRQVLKIDPKAWDSWLNLGIIYGLEENYKEAKICFENGLKHDPKNIFLLMSTRVLEQDVKKGIEFVKQAESVEPNNVRVHALKSELLMKLGQKNEAYEEINKALEIDSNDAATLSVKSGYLIKEKKYNEAIKYLERLSVQQPNNIRNLNSLGHCLIKINDYATSTSILNKALNVDPNNADTQYNIACVKVLLGEINEGLHALERAVKLDPYYKKYAKTDEDFFTILNNDEFLKITE